VVTFVGYRHVDRSYTTLGKIAPFLKLISSFK